jgi:hypothetical protein
MFYGHESSFKSKPLSSNPQKESNVPEGATKTLDSYPTVWDMLNKQPPPWVLLEFPEFSAYWREYFVTDEAYGEFQTALTRNPEGGKVIPGCGGLRKIRCPDPRRAKGKRGGLRIIYLLIPEIFVVVLVDVYDKNEADDLTKDEKSRLSQLATQVKHEILKQRKLR